VDNAAASLKYHLMANQLGLDGDMASVVSSWAFECYEKGLLNKDDTDGLELEWGNAEAMLELQRKIAFREGIGDFLADGVKEAARKLGKGSEKFAIHMKGQDSFDGYRITKGFGFGVSTSPVGGRHLRGAVTSPFNSGPGNLKWIPTEYENIPEAVFWQTQAQEIENLAGVCVYMGTFTGAHALFPEDYAELISAATGVDFSGDDLMLTGKRSYNLEKAFNTLHAGFKRKDDLPPPRYMDEPIKSGTFAGKKCDKDKWEEMLKRFYELYGWDQETGWQTEGCLEELDLVDVAERLQEAERLVES
jgi:aldehyde:ferredoxin oxidoreductase